MFSLKINKSTVDNSLSITHDKSAILLDKSAILIFFSLYCTCQRTGYYHHAEQI